MREIKFRAWDKKKKKWLHGYKELGGCHILGETILLGEWCSVEMARLNDIEVMQYTGLKDKNGKEIYEGDLLKYINPKNQRKEQPLHEVKWSDGKAKFVFIPIGGDGTDNPHGMCSVERFEIIGNIYENPDLIGGVLND